MKLKIANREIVEAHKNIVDEILGIIGIENVFITDISMFSDFCPFDIEYEEETKEKIKNHFGFLIKTNDLISDIVLKIYKERKINKTMH